MGKINSVEERVINYGTGTKVHEQYNTNGKGNNDIALIKLEKDAPMTGTLAQNRGSKTLIELNFFRVHQHHRPAYKV
jgi:hypothetical protein